jgi:hypothetical protein
MRCASGECSVRHAGAGAALTGVAVLTSTLAPKLLDLLHEVVPSAPLVALLVNPKNPNAETDRRSVKSAADTTRQQILVLSASTEPVRLPSGLLRLVTNPSSTASPEV